MKFLKNITHKFQGMSNRKKTVVSIASIIVLASAFLMCNAFFNKNSVLDEVRLKNSSDDTSMFAIMLEQSDGTYKESSDKTWPTGGTYVYDQQKSGCIDANGNTLNGILSYDAANNKAVVKTKQAAYCYLYFSFPLPDVIVEDVDLTKLNSAGYQKTMDCGTTGTATYNTKYQRIEFDSITAPAKCKFNYTEDTTNYPTLNQTIIDLAVEGTSDGTNQEEGDVVHETFTDSSNNLIDTGYRYEGKEPNNYIWFNNELWRIIGVFDTCTALDDSGNCTKTETLTKIIRNSSIGGIVWNTSSNNNWSSSSLFNILNNAYLNSENVTSSEYCYKYGNVIGTICNYTKIGLKGTESYYGSMIKNVVWNLGGISSKSGVENYYASPASTWYTYERGSIVYSNNDTKTTGYVGLIYGSDYGFSVKASSGCKRSTSLYSYYSNSCAGETWMNDSQPLIVSNSADNSSAWYIAKTSTGDKQLNKNKVNYYSFPISPVLYLDSNIYVVSGDGSIINPYQITLAS